MIFPYSTPKMNLFINGVKKVAGTYLAPGTVSSHYASDKAFYSHLKIL